jgi:hypothetical protein
MTARSGVFRAVAAIVVAVVLWSAACWGVDTLASSSTRAASANGDTESTDATRAAEADNRADPRSDNGSPGGRGTQGIAGNTGPTEHISSTGTSGLSALTFSATSATGLALYTGSSYHFSTQTSAVPAGPALVGFTVRLSLHKLPLSFTCSLIKQGNPEVIFATSASLLTPVYPSRKTFAAAQVVSLAEATPLMVECRTVGISGDFPLYYESLSIYAISFSTGPIPLGGGVPQQPAGPLV